MNKSIQKPSINNGCNDGIFFNILLSLSLLKLPWLILASVGVIAIESYILNRFWHNKRLSLRVSLFANLGSTLITGPVLLMTEGEGSIWVILIVATASISEYRPDQIFIYL